MLPEQPARQLRGFSSCLLSFPFSLDEDYLTLRAPDWCTRLVSPSNLMNPGPSAVGAGDRLYANAPRLLATVAHLCCDHSASVRIGPWRPLVRSALVVSNQRPASSSRTSGAAGRLAVVPASSVCWRSCWLATVRGRCCILLLYCACFIGSRAGCGAYLPTFRFSGLA